MQSFQDLILIEFQMLKLLEKDKKSHMFLQIPNSLMFQDLILIEYKILTLLEKDKKFHKFHPNNLLFLEVRR